MSFQRAIVAALAELAPASRAAWWSTIQRQSRAGGRRRSRPASARAARRTGTAARRRRLLRPSTCDLLPAPAPWIARSRMRLPLFTWTMRTPQQRATAERWADAPIFEGYEA